MPANGRWDLIRRLNVKLVLSLYVPFISTLTVVDPASLANSSNSRVANFFVTLSMICSVFPNILYSKYTKIFVRSQVSNIGNNKIESVSS
jgi:hypothetical protein